MLVDTKADTYCYSSYLGIDERRCDAAQRRQSLDAPDQAGKVLLMPDSHDVT